MWPAGEMEARAKAGELGRGQGDRETVKALGFMLNTAQPPKNVVR